MTDPVPPTAPVATGGLRRRAAALVALSLLLVGVVSLRSLHSLLLDWLGAVESLMLAHPVMAAPAFVVFAGVGAMLAFLSSSLLVPAAVGVWGPWGTAGLLWLGWILGGLVMYGVGRTLGLAAVRLFVAESKLERYHERIERAAPFSLVFLFQLALPSEVPGYVLGLIRYPLVKYLAALALAELPYAAAVTVAGESFLAGRRWPLLLVGAAAAGLAVVAWRRLHRHPEFQRA